MFSLFGLQTRPPRKPLKNGPPTYITRPTASDKKSLQFSLGYLFLVVLSPNNSGLLLFLSELSPDTDIDFWTRLDLDTTWVHFSSINCNGTVFFSKGERNLTFHGGLLYEFSKAKCSLHLSLT